MVVCLFVSLSVCLSSRKKEITKKKERKDKELDFFKKRNEHDKTKRKYHNEKCFKKASEITNKNN